MNIKQTGELNVLYDQSFTEKELVINPNDGFDLGLMMTKATVELEFNFGSIKDKSPETLIAQINQKNECKVGTVELGSKSMNKLDGNTKVRLTLEDHDGKSTLIIGAV